MSKQNTQIKALVVPTMGAPRVETITPDLKTFQGLVGGLITAVSGSDMDAAEGMRWYGWANDEALYSDNPSLNYIASTVATIASNNRFGTVGLFGDVVFIGMADEVAEDAEREFADVPAGMVDLAAALIGETSLDAVDA